MTLWIIRISKLKRLVNCPMKLVNSLPKLKLVFEKKNLKETKSKHSDFRFDDFLAGIVRGSWSENDAIKFQAEFVEDLWSNYLEFSFKFYNKNDFIKNQLV